jgi:replicative DNA helicase
MSEILSVDTEFQDQHFDEFVKAMNLYKKYPIYFNNNARDIEYVAKITKRIATLNPDKTIINLFDHSRLFKKSKEASELQMLTELSHTCIELQQQTKCITILLSQLNRNIESPERAANLYQPMLSDIFGCRSVAQDAHVVVIINRPGDMYNITVPYLGYNPQGFISTSY